MTQIQSPASHQPTARPLAPRHSPWKRAPILAAAVLIGAHGLVHLMGTVLLWKLGQPGQLRYAHAAPTPGSTAGYLVGGLWLMAAVLFAATAILLAARRPAWRAAALGGIAISVSVISLAPAQAVAGLVIDGLILILVASSWAHIRITHHRAANAANS